MPIGVYERTKRPEFERFAEKVSAPDAFSCWLWTGGKSKDGYGYFSLNGKSSYAHRYACKIAHGSIGHGLVVDHVCRNPSCVNPLHLEAVTMGENTRRGTAWQVISQRGKAKTHCKRGHAFSGKNLILDSDGNRRCRCCQRQKEQEWKIKNRARVNEMQRIRRAKQIREI